MQQKAEAGNARLVVLQDYGLCLHTAIRGRSMEPLLEDRAEILITVLTKAEEAAPPSPGSILALRTPDGRLVLHRLLAIQADGQLLTQGDGLPYRDALWTRDQLLGLLLAVRRRNKWWRPRHSTGRLAALLAPLRPGLLRRSLLHLLRPFAWASEPRISVPSDPDRHPSELSSMIPARYEVQELGTELAIYDRETGAVHVLNTLAAEIWRCALQGDSPEQIIRKFQSEFPDVTLDQLQHDVLTTVSSLADAGLLPQHP